MTSPKITVLADCGSSPMKRSLRDLNIAFARADVVGIMNFFTDDICWRIIGESELRGTEAVRAALESMGGVAVSELVILVIITDGRQGVINGEITTESGNVMAFCDVCRFAPASDQKIEAMKSYTIEITKES